MNDKKNNERIKFFYQRKKVYLHRLLSLNKKFLAFLTKNPNFIDEKEFENELTKFLKTRDIYCQSITRVSDNILTYQQKLKLSDKTMEEKAFELNEIFFEIKTTDQQILKVFNRELRVIAKGLKKVSQVNKYAELR